jgi:hypothetical protein
MVRDEEKKVLYHGYLAVRDHKSLNEPSIGKLFKAYLIQGTLTDGKAQYSIPPH